jgi:hypothetical protein
MSKRIPETRTLYQLLPSKSADSGREFARIVNLLLFHDARRDNRNVFLFDDRVGDFRGFDAFEVRGKRIVCGYQHKFFPSPLTGQQRLDIEHSLLGSRNSEKKFDKWVLVTPHDLTEKQKRSKGDVSWFYGLREKHHLRFEIEHWGHTKLQALFASTPSIGLHYYPELFPDGQSFTKSIESLRAQYDSALAREFGRIEFVGMSVYKESATRAVPIEKIYIPLHTVPSSESDDLTASRSSPVNFLTRNSKVVVLGHPGTGKTTLIKFLALLGQSENLWKRSQQRTRPKQPYCHDTRLPVIVTLRRYADALKRREDLSLLEHIRSAITADLSIGGVTDEFLEFFLSAGEAILLFDGLDELPSPNLKRIVSNRIANLAAAYPGNTVIVSSRIYGYDKSFGFDEKDFQHHRIAQLRMPEIESFIRDWYDARLEHPNQRKEYLASLLSILSNDQHAAILSLARNPLLLTIIALVHRIDAVLPDERHVLYQKCTETLLNTWHTWKHHDSDGLHRAKTDRQNLQRMQSIAYWMHQRMGSQESALSSVVTYDDAHSHLTTHIRGETPANAEFAPEDIATAFLEFVKERAGLLIEVGDGLYSFVHLTFQEYLTACHIRMRSELAGVPQAWENDAKNHCSDARWTEVLRLLVAGYNSDSSQRFLVRKLLDAPASPVTARLLGGLVLDGVAVAIAEIEPIVAGLLRAATCATDSQDLQFTLDTLRNLMDRGIVSSKHIEKGVEFTVASVPKREQLNLRLVAVSLGLTASIAWKYSQPDTVKERRLVSWLLGEATSEHELLDEVRRVIARAGEKLHDPERSPLSTIRAASSIALLERLPPRAKPRAQLAFLCMALAHDDDSDLSQSAGALMALSCAQAVRTFGVERLHHNYLEIDEDLRERLKGRGYRSASKNFYVSHSNEIGRLATLRKALLAVGVVNHSQSNHRIDRPHVQPRVLQLISGEEDLRVVRGDHKEEFTKPWAEILHLNSSPHWAEAVHGALARLQVQIMDPAMWKRTAKLISECADKVKFAEIASTLLTLDVVLRSSGFYSVDRNYKRVDRQSAREKKYAEERKTLKRTFEMLSDAVAPIDNATLVFARKLRSLSQGENVTVDELATSLTSAPELLAYLKR